MRVLVTGAGGFVGTYLLKELVIRDHQVFAGTRNTRSVFDDSIYELYLNLFDKVSIENIIKEIKPDGIIHLAAQSNVKISWDDPINTFNINTIGTLNLIDAICKYSPLTKLLTIGSSEEYGLSAKSGSPLTEEAPCLPQNPYAISKYSMGSLAIQIAQKSNINIIHVRPFNHFGPGQKEGFVISDFASQIARLELQDKPFINVGNLEAIRDFTDVSDVVDAYISLLENDVDPGIYNVCSGEPREVREILNYLLEEARIDIKVKVDLNRYRPAEIPIFIGSYEKIKKSTGWVPKRNFNRSITETLDWWRQQVNLKH